MSSAPNPEHESTGWLLIVDPPAGGSNDAADASRWMGERILGLPVLLRLALTAQAAGARAIAISNALALDEGKRWLADPRLRLPIFPEVERTQWNDATSTTAIRIFANAVVHRATLTRLAVHAGGRAVTIASATAAAGAGGPYGFEPLLVHDRATAATARAALLRSLRKPQDGWTSTHLNRSISLTLTRALVSTPLTPNQVSVAILAIGLAGAFLASRGTYGSMLAGAALFQAQSILDGCDGEMSRLTFRGSRAGEWLDTIGDDLTNYAFFAGAAWGLSTASGHSIYLALGAVVVSCGIVGSGLEYRYLVRIGSGDLLKYPLGIGKAPGSEPGRPKSAPGRALDAISPLFKRDTFVFLTFLGAALDWLGPFLALAAAGAAGVLATVVSAEIRMSRERRASRSLEARVDPVLPRD